MSDSTPEQPRFQPLLSVVVATSNRRSNLELALRSLELQTVTTFDVVVVDDGSSDATRELVEELCSRRPWRDERLRWVSTGLVPRGLTRARNIGVGNAARSATHIVTLDADVVLGSTSLERMERAIRRYPAAAVFGVVNWLPPDARGAVESAVRQDRALPLWELVPDVVPTRVDGTIVGPDPRPADLFASADEARPTPLDAALAFNGFCAIPVNALRAIDGWDEALLGYGYEDMELGARLRRHGTSALYVSDAIGFHVWHAKDWSRGALEAERNLDYILRRRGRDAVSDAYADWTVWWHYHRERGGAVWAVGDRHYALNRGRTHALQLPDDGWVSRLGFENAEVQPMTQEELDRIQLLGPPRNLSLRRVPHVDSLP